MTIEIQGDASGGNVNINGTQIFNGAVYFVAPATDQPAKPEAIPVFLSYARADDDPNYDDPAKSFMRRLYNHLTAAGFAVWWDRMSLPARGLTFTDEIEKAIRGCQRFVLVVAPGALASDYVRAEWECALTNCKPVTPILRAGDYDIIPKALGITNVNAIDCRPTRAEESAFNDIAERLRQPAPIGQAVGVQPLPRGYITRAEVYNAAFTALQADAIQTTVISAPAKNQSAVAVFGMGGIGKSTLAAALAHDCQIRRHFHDGIIWIEVGQTPTTAALQASIGVHFGDSRDNYPDERDGALSLSRLLQDKTALIVLDDVWDHKLVERFPVSGTACRLLITTRSAALADHVHGTDIKLSTLTAEEGGRLLASWTGADADDPDSRAITELLGGHTLAVTLSAAQIANGYADSVADMLRLLQKRRAEGDPFRDLTVAPEDKDLNLSLSLSLSYDALPADDLRRRFRQTAIFALDSTFDRAALAAIWDDADADNARTPLKTLADAGLLEPADQPGRYMQHRLLRAYAHALLGAENETEATFNRYADYVITQAEQFWRLPPQDWGQLDSLLPHVDFVGAELLRRWDATDNSDEDLTKRAEDFAANVNRYVSNRPQAITMANGTVLRGQDWLEMGLVASRQTGNQRRESLFLNQIALVWDALGEKRQALDYCEQALPIFRAVGDRRGEATTLNNIGSAWSDLGEKRKALDYYEQALLLRRAVGDRHGEATILNNIGLVWDALGEKRKALDYYEQALPLRRAVGDRGGEAVTLNNIGKTWADLGEKRKALDYYEQALPLRRAVGDRSGEATTLNNMALIYFDDGDLKQAVEIFQQIIEIFRAIGAASEEATILMNTSVVYQQMERIAEAIESAQAGRDILIRYNLPQDASDNTLADYNSLLAELRGELNEE